MNIEKLYGHAFIWAGTCILWCEEVREGMNLFVSVVTTMRVFGLWWSSPWCCRTAPKISMLTASIIFSETDMPLMFHTVSKILHVSYLFRFQIFDKLKVHIIFRIAKWRYFLQCELTYERLHDTSRFYTSEPPRAHRFRLWFSSIDPKKFLGAFQTFRTKSQPVKKSLSVCLSVTFHHPQFSLS